MSLAERGLAGGALILALALLRAALGRGLPRRVLMALWWIAAARLILPWEIPCRFSVYTLLARLGPAAGSVSAPAEAAGAAAVRLLPAPGPVAAAAGGAAAIAPAALSLWAWVWLAGGGLLGAWFAVSYIRCRRRFRQSLPVENVFAARWMAAHPGVSVRVSDRISGPLAYGVFRPVILLSKGLDGADETALLHILTHEYIHIRYLDGCAKLVFAGALCLHWWNPAVWLLYVLANRDLELACDEAVVRRLGDPAAYARTLLRMEETRAGLYTCFGQSPIEERIKIMMKTQHKRAPLLLTLCALLAAVCVTTAFATSARQADPPRETALAEQLADSVVCRGDVLSFTLPEEAVDWEIWIAGRIVTDGMPMSVHYLEEESAAQSWQPGRTYQFQLAEAHYEELTVNGLAGTEPVDLSLLPWLPQVEEDAFSEQVAAQWEEALSPYLPLGLAYTFDDPDRDGNGLRMTYQGREVRGILDGETWITEHMGLGSFGEDAGEVRAVYENGVLAGLTFLPEEEQAQWTARRASAAAEAMTWPTEGVRISSGFGKRTAPGGDGGTFHNGVDIVGGTAGIIDGAPVYAALDGTVAETGYDAKLGNYVLLRHEDGLETLYAACREVYVSAGDKAARGETIALVGSTGQSTGPHLHFEVRQDGEVQDPMGYFPMMENG